MKTSSVGLVKMWYSRGRIGIVNEFNTYRQKTKIAVTGIEFGICIMTQIDSNEFQEETRYRLTTNR